MRTIDFVITDENAGKRIKEFCGHSAFPALC